MAHHVNYIMQHNIILESITVLELRLLLEPIARTCGYIDLYQLILSVHKNNNNNIMDMPRLVNIPGKKKIKTAASPPVKSMM